MGWEGVGAGGTASTWKPCLAQKTVQAYECQKVIISLKQSEVHIACAESANKRVN